MAKKRIRWQAGNIVKVDIGNGFHTYGHVSTSPNIIFYDGKFNEDVDVLEIIKLPELFNLFVSHFAIKDGIWPVIGSSELSDDQLRTPYKFKQDSISGKLYIHHDDYAVTNYERPATLEECKELENAAVWDPDHVVDRLNDYFDGKENVWVKQLEIDESRLPEN